MSEVDSTNIGLYMKSSLFRKINCSFLAVLILFFIMFNLVSRPLKRLQTGTEELSKGNWSINVKESNFSPLNDLIVSFNKMTSELESSRKKLIQAEKELIWREMARVMAHEIKNPLTPIRLALERIQSKKEGTTEEFQIALESGALIIHEEIDSLRNLATEFSEFARMPEARISPHNLNEQIQDIILPYQNQAAFELDLSGNLPQFYADKTQIKQVFVNIIQNAIQSSGEECTIRISTRAFNGSVDISISDNGSGISIEDRKKIFEPYFSKRKKGTGLGLAIVKRIIQQHEGTIEVKSEKGNGTTFTLTFPNHELPGETAE